MHAVASGLLAVAAASWPALAAGSPAVLRADETLIFEDTFDSLNLSVWQVVTAAKLARSRPGRADGGELTLLRERTF
jgi:hypothetical protein